MAAPQLTASTLLWIPMAPLAGVVLLGELGLDGTVRAVRGVLPGVLAAARAGFWRTARATAS